MRPVARPTGEHPIGPVPERDGWLRELGALVRLATPLAAANFGNVLIGAVDTAVVGRLGEVPLAAVGLGNALFFAFTITGLGLMLGLDPLLSQAVGADESRSARRLFWQGVYIAVLVGLPLAGVCLAATVLLETLGIDAETAGHTTAYIYARLPGLVPFLWFIGTRSYLQAVTVTRPMVVAVILANLVNLPASWLLVFGDAGLERLGLEGLGLPALGTAGAGWASTLAVICELAILLYSVRRLPLPPSAGARDGRPEFPVRRPDAKLIRRALALGWPIGLQLLAECGVFSIVSVLMGNIGSSALAAHQVALTLASLTFMIPLGIGAAAAVRVGHAVGRSDVPGTRLAGLLAIACGAAFMVLAALAFLLFPRELASVLSDQPSVLAASVSLLLVAAVFQISDGVQVVAAGALRGAGDTRFAMLANVGGHYLVGLPLGVALAFGLGLGATGLWWGLVGGLTAVAISLALRFAKLSTRPVARV